MDISLLPDARLSVLAPILFASVVTVTIAEPDTVPSLFHRMWLRYLVFKEARRIRSSRKPSERFWEVDMTKFEP